MCVHAKSLQLCLTLCDPMDCSLSRSKHRSSCDVVDTVLFFSRYCTVRLKMFSLFFVFVFFMDYLCEKYYTPITVQYHIANFVSWVPRLTLLDLRTNRTYEHSQNETRSYVGELRYKILVT